MKLPYLPLFARKILFRYWLLTRGITLGVRAAIFDEMGHVFLVKHSYVPGWHFPGGGVEAGETAYISLVRELKEEGNIELIERPQLFGIYHNPAIFRRDHVLLYVAYSFRQDGMPMPNHEIIDHGFFAPDDLPEDVSLATRNCLEDILHGRECSGIWP